MNSKKGFTMVELLVAFVIMAFLLGIGVVSYRFIIDRVSANYYSTLEEELLLAGSDYFTNNRTERPLSGYSAVQIDELVGNKYIETLKDRNGKVCDPNSDSKVYIYKTENGYDYEVCLICNEHESSGTYCDNIAMGVINISATKEGGGSYNPLLSFTNASWSNKNVNVTFSVTTDVTKFVITDINSGSTRTCDNILDRSCSMNFSDTSSYEVEAYNDGIEVAPDKGFSIKIDKELPIISYDLAEGNYDENRVVKVTVTDNKKLNSVEYKLYKDDSLVSSGTPTINNETSLNFDNSLDSSGTWRLDVTAVDAAGNVVNETRSFVIETGAVCEWVLASSSTPNNCTATSIPSTPVEGDTYTQCDGPKSGNWQYVLGTITCTNGNTVSGYRSDFEYGTRDIASQYCRETWLSIAAACRNQGSNYDGPNCSFNQLTYYNESKYEYQCADVIAPVISYNLESGTYNGAQNVTVTVTDNIKISSIEYKLYKGDVIVSSGNPTISSEKSVSFDVNLNSSGLWKIDVVASDEAGNTAHDSRDYNINAQNCEWVSVSGYTKTSCESIAKPDNPVAGDKYVECNGPLGSGKWRFTYSQIPCTVGNSIPGYASGYDYGTSNEAGIACNSAWQSAENACYRQGGSSVGGVTCSTQQERYFTEETFEYQCE